MCIRAHVCLCICIFHTEGSIQSIKDEIEILRQCRNSNIVAYYGQCGCMDDMVQLVHMWMWRWMDVDVDVNGDGDVDVDVHVYALHMLHAVLQVVLVPIRKADCGS